MSGYFFWPQGAAAWTAAISAKVGHQKKHTHLLVGMFFFDQEIDPCQEFANSAKRNVGYRLKE